MDANWEGGAAFAIQESSRPLTATLATIQVYTVNSLYAQRWGELPWAGVRCGEIDIGFIDSLSIGITIYSYLICVVTRVMSRSFHLTFFEPCPGKKWTTALSKCGVSAKRMDVTANATRFCVSWFQSDIVPTNEPTHTNVFPFRCLQQHQAQQLIHCWWDPDMSWPSKGFRQKHNEIKRFHGRARCGSNIVDLNLFGGFYSLGFHCPVVDLHHQQNLRSPLSGLTCGEQDRHCKDKFMCRLSGRVVKQKWWPK